MRMMNTGLNIGIIGAGGFAAFAAQAFVKVKGIRIVAVTDIQAAAAGALAAAFQAKNYANDTQLLLDPEIDLVYIATPPYLHYQQSRQALEAGKHVICEKPAALKTSEAEDLANYARAHHLLYTVNLMQRYNPLYEIIKIIIQEQWMGDFVHGFFENYASDEQLTPNHWFWDTKKSGGIFIEHGVHFFDLFSGWLGEGQLVHALQIQRADLESEIIDRVQATVMYEKGSVNFYHGFNQPKLLDRQEMRLQFDQGDITLYEWVPVKIKLHGLLQNMHIDKLLELLPDATVIYHTDPTTTPSKIKGKFKAITYDTLITLEAGIISEKMNRYEQLLIAMIKDQWEWIKNPTHQRKIDENNAVASLRIAEAATNAAGRY